MSESSRIFYDLLRTSHAVFAPILGVVLLVGMLLIPTQWPAVASAVALAGLVSFAGSLLSAHWAAQRLGGTLRPLAAAAERLGEGEFTVRVAIEDRRLVAPLVEALELARSRLLERFTSLQDSRQQLRTVLNSMLEGVIAVDDAQRVLMINESACRMFRLQENAALHRPLWEQVRNQQLSAWLTEALREGKSVAGELELPAPALRILHVRAAALPAPEHAGAVIVASDVTELRRLERVRREFVANASHELKTPVASIKAFTETLLDGALEDREIAPRFLQTISEQADRLDQLIQDMLTLTRLESEIVPLNREPIRVDDIVEVCLARHQQNAERKELVLEVHRAEEAAVVLADREALTQILDNLLDNAIKYTNAGGTVTLSWNLEGVACLLRVQDTGIGIPQNHLSRIYERFYRVDSARSRELGGTGLGLSIVKHFVQALGGSITATSQLGKGTNFMVRLPLAQ